ncbi:MAG: hypothetical protein ACLQEQ_02330 [Nitrososphaerales archaeon]
MSRLSYVYWALAMSSAALVGVLSGFSWTLQAVVLSVLTLALAVDSIRRAEGGSLVENEEPIPRSRVAHYARIARVEDSARLIQAADNPFERALLGGPKWSDLTSEELRALSRRVPKEAEPATSGSEPTQR